MIVKWGSPKRTLGFGGGGGFLPNQLTNLGFWFDGPDSSTRTIATGLSVWADKGPNGFSFLQATGSKQPSVQSAGLNGKDFIRFDGVNDDMVADVTGLSVANISLFIVFKPFDLSVTSYGKGIISFGQGANDWDDPDGMVLAQVDNDTDNAIQTFQTTGGADDINIADIAASEAWMLFEVHRNAGTCSAVVNGSAGGSDSYSVVENIDPTNLIIGNRWTAGAAGTDFNQIDIAEMFLYTEVKAGGYLTLIRDYISKKYGVG